MGEKDAQGVSSSRGGAVAAAGLGQQGGGSGEQNLFQAAGSVQRRKALPNSSHKAPGLCLRPTLISSMHLFLVCVSVK